MLAFNIVEHSYFDAILWFVNPSQLTQASSCSLCPAQVIALSVPTFGSDGDVARKGAASVQLQVAASPADPVFICESGVRATAVVMLPGSGKAAASTVFLVYYADSIVNERCTKHSVSWGICRASSGQYWPGCCYVQQRQKLERLGQDRCQIPYLMLQNTPLCLKHFESLHMSND